jgi:Bacterial conjugation TrbI-like protein
MRVLTVVVLAISVLDAGCGRAETASATNSTTPAADAARTTPSAERAEPAVAREGERAAVATAGKDSASVREVTIPAGTLLPIVLDTAVASDTSRAEQTVTAHLSRPVALHGQTVLPAGSHVSGVVTDATQSGRVKGRAHVALRFDSLSPSGSSERYAIKTAAIGRTAESTKKKDALEIGAPAAGGAIIGALVGGKKGAAVGGAIGGGAGTGVVLSTRGKEVRLPKGSALSLKLAAPVTVRVRS